jgi:hypothetical protein
MEINVQCIITVAESQLDNYINLLEINKIHVDQYTINNKSRMVRTPFIPYNKVILTKILQDINCIDIYGALTNHANELIIKEQ